MVRCLGPDSLIWGIPVKGQNPADSLVEISMLVAPGLSIEIEAGAILD
jgi:hypothetical protein